METSGRIHTYDRTHAPAARVRRRARHQPRDRPHRTHPLSDREPIDRYDRSLGQIDLAVRNTRVLARHSLRAIRAGAPEELATEELLLRSAPVTELPWVLALTEPERALP